MADLLKQSAEKPDLAMFDLTGKTAIVTGGNGGLGFAMARALWGAGANLAIWGRNPSKNKMAELELRADRQQKIVAIEVDVTKQTEIQIAIEMTIETVGEPDILINNAGISFRAKPEQLEIVDYARVMENNVTSALQCCQAVYPFMARRKSGKIINISSMMSIFSSGGSLPYSVSKAGLVQLTRSLAIAWAPDNINVNAIAPGWFETDLTANTKRQDESSQRIVGRTPLGRWGDPRDLAGAAIFLSSPASNFVTGAHLIVDGGFSISI